MAGLEQILKDFIINFSSHGLRRAFYPIGQKPTIASHFFRLIWLFAWGTAAYFMIGQIQRSVKSYLQFKTVISISVQRGDPIVFPTVTICPIPMFSTKRILECLKNNSSDLEDSCLYLRNESQIMDFNDTRKAAAFLQMQIMYGYMKKEHRMKFNQT